MMTYKESLQGAALFFVTSRFAGPAQEMKVRFFFCVSRRQRPKEEKAWRMRMMKWKD
ncbi:MAG: hypothetical protein ACLRP4_02630 [Dialister invisus]|uniref:hypothetical protein n=1 Tax=Dialister invisus TaxID=218538 RepID=UPI002E799789|nr:hypothetical protein [Dialister invisus]MEE1473507.1 hypothetical protein [Dialister invisus]